jgi:hypothetical protein
LGGNSSEWIKAPVYQSSRRFHDRILGSFLKSNGHSHDQGVVVNRQGANLNTKAVPVFVKCEDMVLKGAAVVKSGGYGAPISR